jgi:ankyrin repeat protein
VSCCNEWAAVNPTQQGGCTALICAAQNGHADCVRMLLDRGTALDARNQDGFTALIRAAQNGHADCVWLLLDAGADKEARDKVRGWSLICWCACSLEFLSFTCASLSFLFLQFFVIV